MALLNRFSKLNDRGETGIFTFIVTKSVTRDLHRDATTKDFCFGYHRWAISFQRPTEKMLGVHLLLRNASPSTACVVDFSLTLLNREHFSQNQVYTKKQAKFTITNPMQGVSRWIELSELVERRFSNETGEFLFELSLANMTTIFECDIQLNSIILNQYKQMLKFGSPAVVANVASSQQGGAKATSHNKQHHAGHQHTSSHHHNHHNNHHHHHQGGQHASQNQLINLETNTFTFGSFDWSLTIVPLVVSSCPASSSSSLVGGNSSASGLHNSSASSSQDSFSLSSEGPPHAGGSSAKSASKHKLSAQQQSQQALPQVNPANLEPVCRIYLNRLSGFDSLCRVKYRVILGHHQPGGASHQSAEFVDSKLLDQISDSDGRIRGHQFRHTNVLKLMSLRHQGGGANSGQQQNPSSTSRSSSSSSSSLMANGHSSARQQSTGGGSLDLRVHIEMFCANTISEARVPLTREPSGPTMGAGPTAANEPQVANCSDRNKQNWCVECDQTSDEMIKLKLFFLDLQSVPRNHIRYISWIAYLVRHDPRTGQMRDSLAVKNSPHSNYYLQDGMDLGTIMETDIPVAELTKSPKSYLDASNLLTVHIEWVDSLLLFSHLYNNYDALATIQRHQISRELFALQQEFDHLEGKYLQSARTLNRLLNGAGAGQNPPASPSNNGRRSGPATGAEQAAEQAGEPAQPGAGPRQEQRSITRRRQSSLTMNTFDGPPPPPPPSGLERAQARGPAPSAHELGQQQMMALEEQNGQQLGPARQRLQQPFEQTPSGAGNNQDFATPAQGRPAIRYQTAGPRQAPNNLRCASSMSLGEGQQQQQQQNNYNHQAQSGRLSGGDLLISAHQAGRPGSPLPPQARRQQLLEASYLLGSQEGSHSATGPPFGARQDDLQAQMPPGQVIPVGPHHHQAQQQQQQHSAVNHLGTPSGGASPRSSTRRRLPQPKVLLNFGQQREPNEPPLASSAGPSLLEFAPQVAPRGTQSSAAPFGSAWQAQAQAQLGLVSASFDSAARHQRQRTPSRDDERPPSSCRPQPLEAPHQQQQHQLDDGLASDNEHSQDMKLVEAKLASLPPMGTNRFQQARHSADSSAGPRRRSSGPYSPLSAGSPLHALYPAAGQAGMGASISNSGSFMQQQQHTGPISMAANHHLQAGVGFATVAQVGVDNDELLVPFHDDQLAQGSSNANQRFGPPERMRHYATKTTNHAANPFGQQLIDGVGAAEQNGARQGEEEDEEEEEEADDDQHHRLPAGTNEPTVGLVPLPPECTPIEQQQLHQRALSFNGGAHNGLVGQAFATGAPLASDTAESLIRTPLRKTMTTTTTIAASSAMRRHRSSVEMAPTTTTNKGLASDQVGAAAAAASSNNQLAVHLSVGAPNHHHHHRPQANLHQYHQPHLQQADQLIMTKHGTSQQQQQQQEHSYLGHHESHYDASQRAPSLADINYRSALLGLNDDELAPPGSWQMTLERGAPMPFNNNEPPELK